MIKIRAIFKNKVVQQLFIEGRYPFALSVAWTLYSAHVATVNGWSITHLVGTFFPTFFVMAWFFSHWNRVKKQQTVEQRLSDIRDQIQGMLMELDDKTKNMIGFMTGGDSVCYLTAVPDASGRLGMLSVIHHGQYPLFDISMRIVDLEIFDQLNAMGRYGEFARADSNYHVGDLIPHHGKFFSATYSMGNSDVRKFNVFFTARNGRFTQELRFRLVDGNWLPALRVVDGNGVTRFQNVHGGYPRDAAGEVVWD